MSQLPIPVHVATKDHDGWNEVEALQRAQADTHNVFLNSQVRPPLADPAMSWADLGLEPRWIGYDTTDCAVALNPNIFAGQGDTEFERFCQGAAGRGETAVVISQIGDADPANIRSSLSLPDDSVTISRFNTRVSSLPLGKGARVCAAGDLNGADAQLASRLITCKPPLPWRTLTLEGIPLGAYSDRGYHPPAGALVPLVETEMGEPVVAVWTSPDDVERRYLVPAETPWSVLLAWLTEKALPELVPGALRRARRHMADDPTLTTSREQAAHDALAALEATYVQRRQALLDAQSAAQGEATTVREGLLYGTGSVLAAAVIEALSSAGITVVDLDEHLEGTKNADLLCSFAGRSRLVEVKSASGNPKERIYDDLIGHLREWTTLAKSTPVDGGALIVNHQIGTPPLERDIAAFRRPEFLKAQTEPIITTMEIFEAWRASDTAALVGLLFGNAPAADPATHTRAEATSRTDPKSMPDGGANSTRKPSWFRRSP